ncbi:Lrp/AsnC family transcriptional regulator [Halobacteriaceae archaeon GCM10025711]
MTSVAVDDPARAVLNAFQDGWPVVQRPFEPAATTLAGRGLDVDAAGLLATLRDLLATGAATRFGPRIDPAAFGGARTLAVTRAPATRFDEVAAAVTDHRAVTRAVARDHPRYNLWADVAVDAGEAVADVLSDLGTATGQSVHELPATRTYAVDAPVRFDGPLADEQVDLSHLGPTPDAVSRDSLSPDERALLVAVQNGLPVTPTPYGDVARRLDRSAGWVVETLRRFLDDGTVRSVGVVPDTAALGFRNSLTAWTVSGDVHAAARAVADLGAVARCARRDGSVFDDYDLFVELRARSDDGLAAAVEQVRDSMETPGWLLPLNGRSSAHAGCSTGPASASPGGRWRTRREPPATPGCGGSSADDRLEAFTYG